MWIKLASEADIGEMHRIRMQVRENRLLDPSRVHLSDYTRMLDADGRGWVAEIASRIVGFAIADRSRANIWALFVDPDFEGLGVGRALHDEMVHWLFDAGVDPLWLSTDPGTRAESFYEAAGWRRIGLQEAEVRFELSRQEWLAGSGSRAGPKGSQGPPAVHELSSSDFGGARLNPGRQGVRHGVVGMSSRCAECGAPVSSGGSCREHFDSLLAREWQIPGGPGALPHFFAVATYGLQHPRVMNYTIATVLGLRRAVADALSGVASIEELRRRARDGARRAGRITRRDGDEEVEWHIFDWPMTIVDVLAAMMERDTYAEGASRWARSVSDVLDDRYPMA